MICVTLLPNGIGYEENMIFMMIGLIIMTLALWNVAREDRG